MDDRRWCAVVADFGPLGDPRRFCSGLILLKSLILLTYRFMRLRRRSNSQARRSILNPFAVAFMSMRPPSKTRMGAGRPAGMAPLFSLLGSHTRNALPCPDDPARGHLGAGNLLDLAGGASSVIDLDALPKAQVTNILLARNLLRRCRGNQREHGAAAKHQKRKHRKREAFDGRHLHDRRILSHLFCIFSPFGPTLICRPSGCFLVW